MDKYLNPLECDMMFINCSSLKYVMCHSSRRRQLHRMLLLFTMCLHLRETRHNVLSISLREKFLNTSTNTSSGKAVYKTKLILVSFTWNSPDFLHHLNKYFFSRTGQYKFNIQIKKKLEFSTFDPGHSSLIVRVAEFWQLVRRSRTASFCIYHDSSFREVLIKS